MRLPLRHENRIHRDDHSIVDADGVPIVKGDDLRVYGDEQEAIARLFSAAPDMLHVLDALLLFYRAEPWTPGSRAEWKRLTGSDDATTKALCDAARIAIGKARGRMP